MRGNTFGRVQQYVELRRMPTLPPESDEHGIKVIERYLTVAPDPCDEFHLCCIWGAIKTGITMSCVRHPPYKETPNCVIVLREGIHLYNRCGFL